MSTAALLDQIHHADLFDLCAQLDAASIDMILADLPYGTTACSWDTVIPFEPLWTAFKRVIKPRGAIVLTASQPFTSALVMSNVGMFRYEWVWEKTVGSNPLLTVWQPFRKHENVLVFSLMQPNFHPQMEQGTPYKDSVRVSGLKALHMIAGVKHAIDNIGTRFPSSVQRIANPNNDTVHPTQKPVALFEYLIRTYTREGDVVLDPVVGSGTTAVAARACKRHYICGDSSAEYVAIARDRMRMPFEPRSVKASDDVSDLPLFAQGMK